MKIKSWTVYVVGLLLLSAAPSYASINMQNYWPLVDHNAWFFSEEVYGIDKVTIDEQELLSAGGYYYNNDEEGYRYYGNIWVGMFTGGPVTLFNAEAEVGDEFNAEIPSEHTSVILSTRIVGFEDLTLPCGVILKNVLKIEINEYQNEGIYGVLDMRQTYWLAEGLGIVREAYDIMDYDPVYGGHFVGDEFTYLASTYYESGSRRMFYSSNEEGVRWVEHYEMDNSYYIKSDFKSGVYRILGDYNEDGVVTAADVPSFISELTNGIRWEYDLLLGDFNGDLVFDLNDVAGFQDLLGEPNEDLDRLNPRGPEGDVNGDLKVDLTDLNAVRNNFGSSGPDVEGDADKDGVVGLSDLNAVRNNFGTDLSGAPTAVISAEIGSYLEMRSQKATLNVQASYPMVAPKINERV